ncbi:MAG: UDP-N-acetylmuramoyl-L-alanyl-D-glutamate--2,6-diaminopimelate ligase [Solirubrobacteraceae bacterium]|jgi:UDP-N-acetylmuramoyl-L-alanyl-D-glutamate--2,6-diaminopimelate ligase|nr:UDP-N-acetylmuramoyl-L-alanyl-D-glutamate--2,6-diaminopimelate ligase [Solirubrobacteraceae bacterium]
MRLSELFTGAPDLEVTGLAYDSRTVRAGDLFFCVTGLGADGHAFAPEAIRRGAVALVVERELGLGVPEVVVPLARAEMAVAARRFFGHPSAEIPVVGVTGTNGKTTTSYLLRAMLEAGDRSCGLIGTIKRTIGGQDHPSVRTTPEAIELQRDLREMVSRGDRACVVEVSSHGLALHRCDGMTFAAALLTNLTHEHLDFHGDMESYFQAKRRLFEGDAAPVVNVDDPYGARLARALDHATTFALDTEADYTAAITGSSATRSQLRIRTPERELEVVTALPGRFNAYNVLGAVAAARALGVSHRAILEGLERVDRVPGRFEALDLGHGFATIVDYAHTPDALRNVLGVARGLTTGRLICVFGCAGGRDHSTRPLMGRVARELADTVILTSDDPYFEEPEAIIEEIRRGAGTVEHVEVDRRRAIELAVALARPGDTVLIAGRGHEREQPIGGRAVPFDDRLVAREVVRRRRPPRRRRGIAANVAL